MTGITLNQSFGATNLGVSTTITEQILALPNLLHWFRADENVELAAGKIASIIDKAGTNLTPAQANTNLQPLLSENVFGQYPAISFDSADDRLVSVATVNAEGPFTLALIMKCNNADGGTQAAVSIRTDATNQVFVGFNANTVQFQTGNTKSTAPYANGETIVVLASVNGTSRKFRVNGVRVADGVMSAGAGATAPLILGSLVDTSTGAFGGSLQSVLFFNDDVIENVDALAAIEGLARKLGAAV